MVTRFIMVIILKHPEIMNHYAVQWELTQCCWLVTLQKQINKLIGEKKCVYQRQGVGRSELDGDGQKVQISSDKINKNQRCTIQHNNIVNKAVCDI